MNEKRCSKCRVIKNKNEFYKNKSREDGCSDWCKKCNSEDNKRYRKNNVIKIIEINKKWVNTNPEKIKEIIKRFKENNPEKIKKYRKQFHTKIRGTPKGNLEHRMEVAIRISLKGNKNGRGWEKLVGYTVEELKKHLEKLFIEGMNWKRFLNSEIHIDHIKPKKLFKYEIPEDKEFKECWALTNLQPLWAVENLSKGAKLERK